jgi:predicted ATPase/DNA-binding XRE family transcriptional regulator
MDEIQSFGKWLRHRRRGLDLTQEELAHRVGCAPITIRKLEGDKMRPSKQLAESLSRSLGVLPTQREVFVRFARATTCEEPYHLLLHISTNENEHISVSSLLNKHRTNLPASIATFIGREKEQADLLNLIAKNRLVTVTGTGGIGKTCISLQVGQKVLNEYPDGVWFIPLEAISDPDLVPKTAASVFNIREGTERLTTEILMSVLCSKTALLILDNCEHVLQACVGLISPLLANCPRLKILATSRESLGMVGEAIYRVPSLKLPNGQESLDSFRDSESVRLFEERAQLTHFDFNLTLENATFIALICQRLDGIPLGIELAAAKVTMLSVKQIADQLRDNFHLLARGGSTAQTRHQTLWTAIDWSYNLLTPSEKVLSRRLSVFVGGWTVGAAMSVCSDELLRSEEVLSLLEQLINKSLVIREETGHEGRYRFHETIHQYMKQKLVESGEEQAIRTRHLKYFLKLSEQIEPELVSSQQIEWMSRTSVERHNIRAAIEHAVKTDVEAGLYITSRLGDLWENFDCRETLRWLAQLLQKPEAIKYPHARAKALCRQSGFLFVFERYKEAQNAAEASLALFQATGDRYGQVDSLISLGEIFILGSIADPTKGAELAEQALTSARSLGDIHRQARALNALGWDHRDFKRAFVYWMEATTLYRQVGDWDGLANNLSRLGLFLLLDSQLDAARNCLDEANLLFQQLNIHRRSHLLSGLGQIALMDGDYEQARACFQEDARINSELGSRIDYLWAMSRLGFAELRAGNIIGARQIFNEVLHSFQEDGSQIGVVFTLEGMSSLYVTMGKGAIAARLIGWADMTREKIGDTRPKLEQANVNKTIASCIVKMGEDAFLDEYQAGKKTSLDEAVIYALKGLPPTIFVFGWIRQQVLSAFHTLF